MMRTCFQRHHFQRIIARQNYLRSQTVWCQIKAERKKNNFQKLIQCTLIQTVAVLFDLSNVDHLDFLFVTGKTKIYFRYTYIQFKYILTEGVKQANKVQICRKVWKHNRPEQSTQMSMTDIGDSIGSRLSSRHEWEKTKRYR